MGEPSPRYGGRGQRWARGWPTAAAQRRLPSSGRPPEIVRIDRVREVPSGTRILGWQRTWTAS